MSEFMSPTPEEMGIKSKEQAELNTGKKVYEFLRRTGFLDMRKSDEQFENWVQNTSYEEFSTYLTRLNGILREVAIKDRSIDGQNVGVSFGITADTAYLPPYADQKEGMMQEAFEASKEIPDIDDRALLEYYMVQAVHPYSDGNGRTGRLLYKLMSSEGKDISEDELIELLDHDKGGHEGTGKGRDVFAEKVLEPTKAYYLINREVAKEMLGEQFVQEYGNIFYSAMLGVGNVPAKLDITPEERKAAEKILGEGDVRNFSFRGIVIAKLLQENGKLANCQYEIKRPVTAQEAVSEDVGKKLFAIDEDELDNNLTETDVRRLIEIHREVKEKFVHTMIDVFKHPENHTLKIEEQDIPIKDRLKI